ncbi:MAG TPA: hypothetical protein VGO57_18795 [Verrucomicrobiae bacterium]
MNETPKNKRGWRILRRLLIGVIAVATLIGLVVTEENWRGKRAWENYQREWTAKGEHFDWQSLAPPAVPDDQNFFTAPIFTAMQNDKISITPYGNDGGPNFLPDHGPVGYALYRMHVTDLVAWQNYYRHQTNADLTKRFPVSPQILTPAADVLFSLGKRDSAVEALRQASQRPYANMPFNYPDGFNSISTLLPILAELKRCSQLLQLRSSAELADGQSARALEDVKLFLYLNQSLRNSPFLISHLVRVAIANITMQPIWEGLAAHTWSDEQLAALNTELGKMDFLADCGSVIRGERAFAIAWFENQRHTREMISDIEIRGRVTNSLAWMPSAYFYQNELNYARASQQWILPLVDTNSRIISPAALRRINDQINLELKHYSLYKVQSLTAFPSLVAVVKKVCVIQTSINLARIACALERYRLAHGEYPETLAPLTPQFIAQIPHDLINGQPLHYHREANGQFTLYSVGWNETDDGGTVALTKMGNFDPEKGDWIWQYPAK